MNLLKYINKILPHFKAKKNKNIFNNVLVVSNTGLGDTLFGIPAIKTLRKSFPHLKITFLINENIYPIFKKFQYVDDFILYSTGLVNQFKIIKQIKDKKIDTIFLFHSNGPEDIFFSVASGAKNILKMTDDKNHEFKNIFSNKPNTIQQHVIEKKIDLVRLYNPSIIDTTLEISSKFNNKIADKLKTNTQILIGFQVGAQDTYKMWPIDKFILLGDKLLKSNPNITIVLLGATAFEKKLTDKFIQNISDKNKVINLCGSSSIDELPLIINSLELLVTNDTGTLHLSIALSVPTVSLFGPTNSKEFGPYQDFKLHKIIQKDGFFVNNKPKKKRTQEGINLIEVEEVFKDLKGLLNDRLTK